MGTSEMIMGPISGDIHINIEALRGLVGLLPNMEDRVWGRHILDTLKLDMERVAALENWAVLAIGPEDTITMPVENTENG